MDKVTIVGTCLFSGIIIVAIVLGRFLGKKVGNGWEMLADAFPGGSTDETEFSMEMTGCEVAVIEDDKIPVGSRLACLSCSSEYLRLQAIAFPEILLPKSRCKIKLDKTSGRSKELDIVIDGNPIWIRFVGKSSSFVKQWMECPSEGRLHRSPHHRATEVTAAAEESRAPESLEFSLERKASAGRRKRGSLPLSKAVSPGRLIVGLAIFLSLPYLARGLGELGSRFIPPSEFDQKILNTAADLAPKDVRTMTVQLWSMDSPHITLDEASRVKVVEYINRLAPTLNTGSKKGRRGPGKYYADIDVDAGAKGKFTLVLLTRDGLDGRAVGSLNLVGEPVSYTLKFDGNDLWLWLKQQPFAPPEPIQ